MEETKLRPVLFICLPHLTRDHREHLRNNLQQSLGSLKESGWVVIVLDGFEKADIKAFGVPSSELEKLHNVVFVLSGDSALSKKTE
jgi:hypothetical protein